MTREYNFWAMGYRRMSWYFQKVGMIVDFYGVLVVTFLAGEIPGKEETMSAVLVFLFPALAIALLLKFIRMWRKGVKQGYFQKGKFVATVLRRKK